MQAIVGENDPALGADAMEQTWLGSPERELDVLANAGHYAMYETPVALSTSIEVPDRVCATTGRPPAERRCRSRDVQRGVPFARSPAARRRAGGVGRGAGAAGLPGGPGFWLVLRHADVERVLRDPGDLLLRGWARPRSGTRRRRGPRLRPPDDAQHGPAGALPAAAAAGPLVHPARGGRARGRIDGTPRAIVDRMFAGPRGECDFAKDVAADLPLLTLADVLGVPARTGGCCSTGPTG